MEVTERTDEQLAAEAAREGSDGPAFMALVGRYRQRVWRVCYRLLGNEQDVADAAQEVFLRLFLQRNRFEGRSKYSTWVQGIALRTCLSLRRGRGRRQRRESLVPADEMAGGPPDRAPQAPGLALDLQQLLETLDEEDRALVILKYAEGYDYDELSAMFEISPSACKMRVSRAREKLQQRYPDLCPQSR